MERPEQALWILRDIFLLTSLKADATTFTAITREPVARSRRNAMTDDIRVLRAVRYAAIAAGLLLAAGIVILMVLARGKTGDDGDIAGVVAPALFLACVSGVVAVVAAVRQKRAQRRVVRP
jgi:O-antigen/teichoic acid export membrane protein